MKKFVAIALISFGFAILLCTSLFEANAQGRALTDGTSPPHLPSAAFPVGSSTYKAMQVTGLMGDWSLGGKFGRLKNIQSTLWEGFETLSQGSLECKFAANNSWNIFWGSSTTAPGGTMSGIACLKGGNIPVQIPATGQYRIRFDDSSCDYSFTRADGAIPPVAVAGPDMTIGIGGIAVFDAHESYDSDGTISNYAWSNGLSGVVASMVYDVEGVYDVSLTVTDNSGNTAQDSVRVTVVKEIPFDDDFRANTIYSLITSRFNNGDQENDFYCRERVQKGDPHWRGDFKGLIEKLDYIKDLGFSAICISPPIENRSGLDYHGNHGYDWMKIDPRLESTGATYKDFIAAAHAEGFKVIHTLVLNHSSNYGVRNQVFIDRLPHKFYRKTGMVVPWPYIFNLGNYKREFREDNDNPRAPEWFQDQLTRDPWGKGPLTDLKTGTVLPRDNYDPERFFGTEEKNLNTEWYHRNGWLPSDSSDAASLQTMHLDDDSIDFATENWKVKNYINQAVRNYIDMGIDAVRIDFARHTDRNELLTMIYNWREYKNRLFIIGDVQCEGTGWGLLGDDKQPSETVPWWYNRLGNDPKNPDSGKESPLAPFDYPLFKMLSSSIPSGNFHGVGETLVYDWVYGDPTHLITFFHNQDYGPSTNLHSRFNGEQWKASLAYTLLWTARGIPCLFYGEESEFMKGAPQNVVGSTDLLSTTGRAYYGDSIAASNLSVIQSHPLYKHIKRLNLIRSKIPALQKGAMSQGNEWISGVSFIRDYNNASSYAVVGIAAGSAQDITVDHVRNGTYRDAITGLSQSIESSTITFSVKANSAGIWVLNGSGKIGQDETFLR